MRILEGIGESASQWLANPDGGPGQLRLFAPEGLGKILVGYMDCGFSPEKVRIMVRDPNANDVLHVRLPHSSGANCD